MAQTKKKGQISRFDLVAVGAMAIIGALSAAVWVNGDRTPLHVTSFSWAEQTLGAEDQQLTLAFNGPIDPEFLDVQIEPALPGTLSSNDRALVYTLAEPPIYGTAYQVSLQGSFQDEEISFVRNVPTRDRLLAYIGVDEAEQGRLILYNLTQEQKSVLTPADLVVTDVAIYGSRDRLLFSAYERYDEQGFSQQQLYTVTTGLEANATPQPSGRIHLLLDAQSYQNVKFDVAEDGKTMVVQRVNRQNPAESGLWIVSADGTPRPLGIPAENFVIAPDGHTVAVEQSTGIALIPIDEGGSSQFYPGYSRILAFSADGTHKLLVKYNPDYTRSLFIISAEEDRELFRTVGPIIDCRFKSPETLFCLKTELIEDRGQYREEPYLAAIKVETNAEVPLLALPTYQDVQLSISPDRISLLFDQVATSPPSRDRFPITQQGQAIAAGLIWQLPLNDFPAFAPEEIVPEELVAGFHPVWLP
ncbi:MAG: Ig-like domain-containing protein [Cyanophyceae cyanobacterium]